MGHLNLPKPIAAYFHADMRDSEAVARCFHPAAVVQDDGKTYCGHRAIACWGSDAAAKYSYTSEALELRRDNGRYIVRSRVAGNFPGSPVELALSFRVHRGKIAALEVTA
ncbi:MAG: nuclear transport factor 2 family protein [Gammaproteobacteria bacterium]